MKATKQSHDWHCHNHDTYGWRGEECKQCKVAPSEVEQLVFRNERLVADYASLQEENNALRRIHAENLVIKDAEIARLKTVPMKYRRMEFNAQLQVENAALKEQVTQLQTIITEEAKESGEVIIERDTLKERIARLEDLNRKLCDKANTLTIQSARLEETITALQSKSAALVDALTNAQSRMPCPMYEEALAAFKG